MLLCIDFHRNESVTSFPPRVVLSMEFLSEANFHQLHIIEPHWMRRIPKIKCWKKNSFVNYCDFKHKWAKNVHSNGDGLFLRSLPESEFLNWQHFIFADGKKILFYSYIMLIIIMLIIIILTVSIIVACHFNTLQSPCVRARTSDTEAKTRSERLCTKGWQPGLSHVPGDLPKLIMLTFNIHKYKVLVCSMLLV